MAWAFSFGAQMLLVFSVFFLSGGLRSGDASSFKFSIHHRFSDAVKGIIDSEGFPEKHSPEYYATLVHRDRLVHGRRLAASNGSKELTFAGGNATYLMVNFGFLLYANISIGTPALDFFVALDTGSNLFWLPCECRSCPTSTPSGKIPFSHYSPNASKTSSTVPCSNALCELSNKCTSNQNTCPYKVKYGAGNESSTGYLVEDVVSLITDDSQLKPVKAKITFGCGKVQTGRFARHAAPNGLIGLGMERISVPSFLANQGLISDSFSMCFGHDEIGRIDFGDTGTPDQKETPINSNPSFPHYNVTITQIIVGGKTNDVQFTAIFDGGASLYAETIDCPVVNFTMKGGDDFIPLGQFLTLSIDDADTRRYNNGAATPYGYTTPFDSPPTDKSPPSDDSPPAPVTPGGSTGLPNIEVGVATRLNPLTSVFVAVLAILAVVVSLKFNIHRRFSDSIKGILNSDGLLEKHTPGYYAAMVHRDRLLHARRLATSKSETPLTFSYDNHTYRYGGLGDFYYANISVGTPELGFLVALDTGSDLSWLPCECSKCRTSVGTSDGEDLTLNHYSPNASTTSKSVACSNSLCELADQCPSNKSSCPYKIHDASPNTSSSGYLVEDILHLATNDSQSKPVDAKITFGCGKVQTGIFSSIAINGLLGLGMGKISVPSLLASQELTPDSFSMCFGYDGYGNIDFGDIGPSDQRETSLNPHSSSYNVTIIQITVAGKPNNVEFTTIFDSGFSYTYLSDPIYTFVTQNDKGGYAICLTIAKSTDINLFGLNFMAGHRIVFNREKMVLGWNEVNCSVFLHLKTSLRFDNGADNSPPSNSPPADAPSPSGDSPPAPSTPRTSNSTQSSPGIGTGDATQLNPLACLSVVLLAILSVV
ncbi:Aspartyl protease family protein 1 [Cucurbita argyrosperma subsp. argyrosperma]|nr:Aspartyl protease family protein 1 [Cucurbita argyrosperma subsp. argyrosperma]